MIHSDLHIHSEYSYDSKLPLETILREAEARGFRQVGVTDHLNLNNDKFIGDIRASAEHVLEAKKTHPNLLLGVELTPIQKPLFDYYAKHPSLTGYIPEGYTPPSVGVPYAQELGLTKDELKSLGVQYAVAAAHWRTDCPSPDEKDKASCIKDWHSQQMYLACDERTTILAHPYYHGHFIWYDDFSAFPHSMHEELAAALKEHGKLVEMNINMICHPYNTEAFRHSYAEFMRFLFEYGVRITFGSDCHNEYTYASEELIPYLTAVGFRDGDFSELAPSDLWQ